MFRLPKNPITTVTAAETSVTVPSVVEAGTPSASASSARGFRFWLIFFALGFALFLSPLELVSSCSAHNSKKNLFTVNHN